jgi:hypothetical protein
LTTFKLKTALPALEVATTDAVPTLALAVKPMLALPAASVVAVAVVEPPVNVPAPDVANLNVTVEPTIGAPALFNANTSRSTAAAVLLVMV